MNFKVGDKVVVIAGSSKGKEGKITKVLRSENKVIVEGCNIIKKHNKGNEADFAISQTFLRGHFKGYSIALSPLDGVYYSDLRPVMKDDIFLKKEIKRLDELICKDIWKLIHQKARKKVF